MDHSSALTVILRIAVALLIGGVIGLERTSMAVRPGFVLTRSSAWLQPC